MFKIFFRRAADRKPSAAERANEDVLKDMIRRLIREIEEHNAEYQHRTPQALIDEAKQMIGATT